MFAFAPSLSASSRSDDLTFNLSRVPAYAEPWHQQLVQLPAHVLPPDPGLAAPLMPSPVPGIGWGNITNTNININGDDDNNADTIINYQNEAKPTIRGRKPIYAPVDAFPKGAATRRCGLDNDGASLPDGPQRTHALERDHAAATKCWLKKRDEASTLSSREQTVEDQNRYIAHEAKKTVENMTGFSKQSGLWSDPFTTSSRSFVDYNNISPTNPEQGHEYYLLP
ncbi:hypothetical protein S40288_09918 [Stachybotrys chartarum IBT 40288]|nr:hypothetical protein S40288_09918 [Stachybotrys chartarum IBT 40288]